MNTTLSCSRAGVSSAVRNCETAVTNKQPSLPVPLVTFDLLCTHFLTRASYDLSPHITGSQHWKWKHLEEKMEEHQQ